MSGHGAGDGLDAGLPWWEHELHLAMLEPVLEASAALEWLRKCDEEAQEASGGEGRAEAVGSSGSGSSGERDGNEGILASLSHLRVVVVPVFEARRYAGHCSSDAHSAC